MELQLQVDRVIDRAAFALRWCLDEEAAKLVAEAAPKGA